MRPFLLLVFTCSVLPAQDLDLLFKRGQLVDGSGGEPRNADVGIRGDRIAFVGDAAKAGIKATKVIDVKGLVVSPGFIDPHTHTLEDLSGAHRANQNYLLQGVTTVITGNDGGGPVSTGPILAKWREQGIGTNASLYVGQGTVRGEVMGMTDSAPTPLQLASMKRMVKSAMDAGALGLSAGLFYAPGSYAKSGEVTDLARMIAPYGGVYDTHVRDESSYGIGVLGAVQEAIDICHGADVPLHLSHIKVQGPAVWGKSDEVIAMIRKAQSGGMVISADQYPYTGSGTSLTASLMPRWAQVGGNAKMLARMKDPVERPKVIADMEKNLAVRGGASLLLLTTARDKNLIGKTLEQLAKTRNQTPVETALEIIQQGGAGIASLNIQESDIENFMKQDFVVTGSDGSAGHPRKYGTFPRKLRVYVRERHVITLPFFVSHSSAKTAEMLHLPERGMIKAGYFADLVAFDFNSITDKATYERPELFSEGVQYVVVNGRLAVEKGTYNGALAGRALVSHKEAK